MCIRDSLWTAGGHRNLGNLPRDSGHLVSITILISPAQNIIRANFQMIHASRVWLDEGILLICSVMNFLVLCLSRRPRILSGPISKWLMHLVCDWTRVFGWYAMLSCHFLLLREFPWGILSFAANCNSDRNGAPDISLFFFFFFGYHHYHDQ